MVGASSFSTLICCCVVLCGWAFSSAVVINSYFQDFLLLKILLAWIRIILLPWVLTVIPFCRFFVVKMITLRQRKEFFLKWVIVATYNSALFHSLCALQIFFVFTMDNKINRNQLLLYLDRQFVTKYCSKYYVKPAHVYTFSLGKKINDLYF